MLSFIQYLSESFAGEISAKSLHKDSQDHEFLGYTTKESLEKHYDKIREYHGKDTENRHRKQDSEDVASKRHKLAHKEPTHTLTATIVNNFRKITAGTKVTQHMNKPGVYTIRDGKHVGTFVKTKPHQVEKLK